MAYETVPSRIFLSTSAAEEAHRQSVEFNKQIDRLGENIDSLNSAINSLAKILHPSLAKTSSPPETSTPAVIVQSVKQEVADDQQEIIDVQQASPVDLTEMEIVPLKRIWNVTILPILHRPFQKRWSSKTRCPCHPRLCAPRRPSSMLTLRPFAVNIRS